MSETGFTHISVTPAEEEDFVIHAGVSDDAGAQSPDAATSSQGASTASDAQQGAELAPEAEAFDEEVPDAALPVAKQAEQKPAQRRKQSSKRDDGYRETTLEDLESTEMPLAQRIVIIAAIVCIIGAVIYYLAFMR